MNRKLLHSAMVVAMLAVIVAGCQPVPIPPEEPATGSSPNAAAVVDGPLATGGPNIWRNANIADAENLNPILSADTASSGITNFMFPALIGQDPFTGEFVTDGALAESWEISDDNLIYTFKLRDNVKWSDGDAVDSADFKFTYDAIASDLVETPRKSLLQGIESIETPDPLTIVVKFSEARCDGLGNLGLALLPSHLYKADFSDVMTLGVDSVPVSAGPFTLKSWTRDDNIVMESNPSYWEGAPKMEGSIVRVVPDPAAQLAQFQAGELDVIGLQPDQIEAAKAIPNTTIYNFKDDGYDYVGLNLANPENPQPGRDENGNLIEQEPHPILGDVKVRKAIAHSLDYATIIDTVYLKQGYQIAANVLPAIPWAFDAELQPYAFDLDAANALLDEAGWTDADGNGIREKDGKSLELSLITNAGNKTREDLGALVQDQLKQVGIDVKFEAIDFGVVVEQLLGQKFDMVIIGWTGTGTDPNDENLWSTQFDTPDSGFNFVSYHNAEMDDLLTKGVTVAGCKSEDRAPFYKQIQKLIHDDVPYVFISGGVGNIGYSNRWEGIDPGTWSFAHNIQEWSVKQ